MKRLCYLFIPVLLVLGCGSEWEGASVDSKDDSRSRDATPFTGMYECGLTGDLTGDSLVQVGRYGHFGGGAALTQLSTGTVYRIAFEGRASPDGDLNGDITDNPIQTRLGSFSGQLQGASGSGYWQFRTSEGDWMRGSYVLRKKTD
jgi:hypothetical protein